MAKPINDSHVQTLIAQGDKAFDDRRFGEAHNLFESAYNAAVTLYGYLQPELLPILEKWVASSLHAHNQEWQLKAVIKNLRTWLAIAEYKFGLNAPELVPVLTRLVQFYDYDGAHMLAIEVKQRIDDIVQSQAALTT